MHRVGDTHPVGDTYPDCSCTLSAARLLITIANLPVVFPSAVG